MSKQPSNRFIFVGGSPRSGTTLIQNILDSHPDICGGPEFLRLIDIVQLRKKLHKTVEKGWIVDFCSYEDIDNLMSSLIEDLLLPLADKQQTWFLSEKTPSNVLVFSELIELFPNARFIHVVRDPRAIIASMLQVGKRGGKQGWNTQDFTKSTIAAIHYVRRCFKSGFKAAERSPHKILTVAYERLVTDVELETKRICNFLEVEWTESMMYPGAQTHLGEQAICNDVWYDEKTYKRDVETKEINKWQKQLNSFQKIQIVAAFSDFLERSQIEYSFSSGLSLLEYKLAIFLSVFLKMALKSKDEYPLNRIKGQFNLPVF